MEPSGTVVEPSAEPSVFPMFSYTFSTPPVFTLCTYYIIINSRAYRNRRTSGGPGPSRILIGGLGASIGRVLCGHLWAFALMWPVRKRKTWWFQQHSGAGEPPPLLLLDVLNQFFEGRLAPEHARNGVWAASSCSTAPPLLARRSRKLFSRSCGHCFDAHDFSKKVLKLI